MQITLLRRTLASSPWFECAGFHQQGHAGNKSLHQQSPTILNWRCWPTQVDLYNGRKVGGCNNGCNNTMPTTAWRGGGIRSTEGRLIFFYVHTLQSLKNNILVSECCDWIAYNYTLWWVYLSVCLSVCLLAYLRNPMAHRGSKVEEGGRAYSKEFFEVHNFKSSCMM